jgi:putative toxin-antitoxin system antitoxin component (TIGR02293 family)
MLQMSQSEIRSLGVKAASRIGLGAMIHAGLPAAKVSRLLNASGWNKSQLFAWAHIPPANGNRRFKAGRFEAHESERIARLARLFDEANDMLRSPVRATEWLVEPNPRLGGVAPVEAAGTELGAAEVEALIGRLRHGVY